MDERKYLVLHQRNDSTSWYDATSEIASITNNGNCWRVKFYNTNRYYNISFSKLKIYDNPKTIEFYEIYYKNKICVGATLVLLFSNSRYKIFLVNGSCFSAKPEEVRIVRNLLTTNKKAGGVMAYYKRVVQEIADTEEEDDFLVSQFEDIDYVNEDSALALYLSGKLERSNIKLKQPFLSPFGTNLSQLNALKMVFENRISIIEGPPGTGKTQTILNIIANAVVNNLSVAVVSNNNSATDNVFEKLDKYGYSFIAAPLGNVDNVDLFFDEYTSDIPAIPIGETNADKIRSLNTNLPGCFANENKKRQFIEQINEVQVEYNHFLENNKNIDFNLIRIKPERVNPSNVLDFIIKLKESKKRISFWTRLIIRIKLKLNKSFFLLNSDEYLTYLYNLYYLSKINQLKNKVESINRMMNHETLNQKVSLIVDLSKIYFGNMLFKRYEKNNRSAFAKDNYKRKFDDFVYEYPVILSSTYSLARCSKKGFLFDYLIIDESSQVNMASAILSMRIAKNLVVVGDIKQLPQIDDRDFKDKDKQLLEEYSVSTSYSYYGNSIMSSLISLYRENIPTTTLVEHYRCNPDIIGFCNKRFYNNELIVYTSRNDNDYSMKVIKTAQGNFARKNPDGTGQYNQREIDEIEKLIDSEALEDVGIITPYRYQSSLIQDKYSDSLVASTVHSFQGREKKTIIFSSVVNSPNEFVNNDNLINVAVSRAINKFILVTSDKIAKSNSGVLSDLVNYISYNTEFGQYEEGNIKSIYDILYEEYDDKLKEFRRLHPSKDYDTENITKQLLKEILSEQDYSSLAFAMHVPLRDFIRVNNLNLSPDKMKFFRNPNSHVDFLIFGKMGRKPLLAIEVDGVSFHEQRKEQQERDAKKDSILEKAGVKLLRLKTNESEEEERIKRELNSII